MTTVPESDQDQIFIEASEWIVRASEDDFSQDDARALANWRTADLRHDCAYLKLKRLWDELPALTNLNPGALAPIHSNDDNDDDDHSTSVKSGWWRWKAGWSAGLVVAAMAAVIAFLMLPGTFNAPAENYATGIAQMNEITLSDGSVATLGPKTKITVKFSDAERRVSLTGGEAFFEVTKNPAMPFVVETGHSIVRVVGTKFNVNRGDQVVRVAVLQGVVQIRGNEGSNHARLLETLHNGQRAEIVANRNGTPMVTITTGDNRLAGFDALAGSWREGWLVYENARLGDIISDINRYYSPGVTLVDPGLGDLRVTASFKVTEIPTFIASLDRPVSVVADKQPNGGFRLRLAK